MAESVSLMSKKLLTGSKCRSDSFFCHDGGRIRQWWKRWNGRKEKPNINVWKIKMKLRPELMTQMEGSKNAYLGISCTMSGTDRWHIHLHKTLSNTIHNASPTVKSNHYKAHPSNVRHVYWSPQIIWTLTNEVIKCLQFRFQLDWEQGYTNSEC